MPLEARWVYLDLGLSQILPRLPARSLRLAQQGLDRGDFPIPIHLLNN